MPASVDIFGMDAELLVRISTAFDEHPTLRETDAFLHELAIIRRKDDQVHQLADQLLDYRALLTAAVRHPETIVVRA